MAKKKDLTGLTFGCLTVLREAGFKRDPKSNKRRILWLARCTCGNEALCTSDHIANVCLDHCSQCSPVQVMHGLSKHRIYKLYNSIKLRCYSPSASNYRWYGGRGVTMCPEWLDKRTGFMSFFAFVEPLFKPGLEIDRIDNSKGYSPDNCRFVTMVENKRNMTNNHLVVINGEQMHLTDAIKRFSSVSWSAVFNRIKRGWSVEDAVLKPAIKNGGPRKW